MNYETIIFKKEDGVATITLNRPDVLNALNYQMAEDLFEAIKKCGEDAAIKTVVITGAGRAFCAGGDVNAMRASFDDSPAAFIKGLTKRAHKAILGIRNLKKPVIVSINGFATGIGFTMTLACDLRVASEKAYFSSGFIRVGLIPDGGGTYFLPRLVGLGKATELFFTSDVIDANEALKLGIVNKVVPEDDLERSTKELAIKLAKGPPLAIAKTKALINQGLTSDIESQLENERQAQILSSQTDDFKEGLTAFFEKREPKFQGR